MWHIPKMQPSKEYNTCLWTEVEIKFKVAEEGLTQVKKKYLKNCRWYNTWGNVLWGFQEN